MIGKEKIVKLLKEVIYRSNIKNAEALFIGAENGLTRYANSYIHQNVAEQDSRIFFKVVIDQKIGVSSTNYLNSESLSSSLNEAAEIAERARPNPYFKAFAKPAKYQRLNTFDMNTSKVTPAARAAIVKSICTKAVRKNLVASGAMSTSASEIALVNTNGLVAYQPLTSASISIIISSGASSG